MTFDEVIITRPWKTKYPNIPMMCFELYGWVGQDNTRRLRCLDIHLPGFVYLVLVKLT